MKGDREEGGRMEGDRNGGGRKGRAGTDQTRKGILLLRSFLIGVVMALVWGAVSSLLNLDRLIPGSAGEMMFTRPIAFQLIFYGFVSPVLEEVLFRKLLYDLAVRILPHQAAAVLVSALFALWHGDLIQMLYAFPAGLILQMLRARSGTIKQPVLCHIGANLTAIFVTALIP